MGPVLTDKVAVVSWCSQDSNTCHLQSFDLATGKPANKTEWSRIGHDGVSPYLYPQTGDTFLVNDGQLLTEFGSDLKPRSRLNLPAGMGLAPSPGYGYSDWVRVTNVNCTATTSLFDLVGGRKLFLGCGGMGVLDGTWKLVFAERYGPHNGFGWPVISQDGGRFILPLGLHYMEPPLHTTLAFLLYDLRAKSPREFVFRTADELYALGRPAISPDGTRLALLGTGKLSVYILPK